MFSMSLFVLNSAVVVFSGNFITAYIRFLRSLKFVFSK